MAGIPGQYQLPSAYQRPSALFGGNGGNAGMAVGNGYMMPAYSQQSGSFNYPMPGRTSSRGFHIPPNPATMVPPPTDAFGQTLGIRAGNGGFGPQLVFDHHNTFEDIWYSPPSSFVEPSFSTPSAHAVSSPASSPVAENVSTPSATGGRRRLARSIDPATFPVPYFRHDKGNFLQQGREFGLSFRQLSDLIRAQRLSDDDTCNESSLRGIYRAHMKTRAERPRKPEWDYTQVSSLHSTSSQ